ncbi:MAG: hypothetical protein ABSE41_06840 [Bacteroidota bacterium]|jgi:hypothetical protein
MDTSVLMWFIVFVISALLFFGTAVVITVIGVQDLKDLLSRSTKKEGN